ncbi:hypothetical protein JCM10908_005806 [Rhodotorula pacifica]|uniref:uncharacterized protein n=1 Tax=Rhodotorula pacifica TaxID=1495444 RepID=UPI003172A7D3
MPNAAQACLCVVLGYGAMGLSHSYGHSKEEVSKETLRHAISINQHNEKLLGEVLREGNNRSKVTVATKWGLKYIDGQITPDGSPEFARHCIDQSTKNLGRAPDIWLLHRIDS